MEKHDIKKIQHRIYRTLERKQLTVIQVIDACDRLALRIQKGTYDEVIRPLVRAGLVTDREISQVSRMLSRKELLQKVERELGKERNQIYPLGVLFHVNPENAHGIAAYSVIEGLLAGNINLVKLPVTDAGITEFLLSELMRAEPLLNEYIYLCPIRSTDAAMAWLVSLADAVIVWGGDAAIKAVRAMVKPNQKIIEWGHKISFAYITRDGMSDENLQRLAKHIIETKQMLCSSCQGIYIEEKGKAQTMEFCRRMMDVLKHEVRNHPEYDQAWTAKSTLNRYTYMLEHEVVFMMGGEGLHLLYCRSRELEPAIQYGNIWVKMLGRRDIIKTLKRYHGYLQTVGLICGEEEREALAETWIKAGVTNVRGAGDMSLVRPEDSHDGEFPLRRYSKVVCVYPRPKTFILQQER